MKFHNKSIVLVGIFIIFSFAVISYFIGEKIALTARKMSVDLAVSKAQNSFLIVKNELEESIVQTRILANTIEEAIENSDYSEEFLARTIQSGLHFKKELNGCWFVPAKKQSKGNAYRLYFKKRSKKKIRTIVETTQLDLFEQVKRSNKEKISAPYKNKEGALLVSILFPVRKKGELVGVLGTDLDLYQFQQHFYESKEIGRAYVSIISHEGYCITHPDEKLIGKRMDTLADGENVQKALASGQKYRDELKSEFLQVPVIRLYQPIKIENSENNWLITVSVPLFNVKESVQEIRNSTLLIGLVLAVLLMILLYFSQRKWFYEFSQRQRAEKKQRNIENKLSSLMESTDQIMIFSINKNYKYTSFNTVYRKEILQHEGINIAIGDNLLEAYSDDFRQQMKEYLDRALAGEHFLVEYKRNGIYYQQIFNAIFDEGKVAELSSFRFDISETVELRQRAQEEKEEKVKAQLKNIQNQINPHFLFNSLNSLYALVQDQPSLARKFITNLSKVYRYLLDSNNSSLISLQQEMDFTKRYLFLQKIRFGDRLVLDYEIPEEALCRKLPSVSIQSLVENAIKHNVITKEQPLTIRIFIEDQDFIVVENPYQTRSDLQKTPGSGLKTLKALYGFLGDKQPVYGLVNGTFRVKLPLF